MYTSFSFGYRSIFYLLLYLKENHVFTIPRTEVFIRDVSCRYRRTLKFLLYKYLVFTSIQNHQNRKSSVPKRKTFSDYLEQKYVLQKEAFLNTFLLSKSCSFLLGSKNCNMFFQSFFDFVILNKYLTNISVLKQLKPKEFVQKHLKFVQKCF